MSSPYDHIVCCMEHESEASPLALAEARRLRALGPGRLTLIHVIVPPVVYPGFPGTGTQTWIPDPTETRTGATSWLSEIAQQDEQVALIDHGYPPAVACEWAASNAADLMVAASHRGYVVRALLGSFAGYLARHAPCAVLLVRPPRTEQ
jgi:nucleotide-binding universal stress UspA family protein